MTQMPRPLLRMLVQCEALVSRSMEYLQGVGWRIRGLKVRSRHRFSALMGHTSHAYDLWMASREVDRILAIPGGTDGPPLLIVIDCRAQASGSAGSLGFIAANQAQAVAIVLLGPAKARFDSALAALKRIWKADCAHDPFHHSELSQFSEQFVVRM